MIIRTRSDAAPAGAAIMIACFCFSFSPPTLGSVLARAVACNEVFISTSAVVIGMLSIAVTVDVCHDVELSSFLGLAEVVASLSSGVEVEVVSCTFELVDWLADIKAEEVESLPCRVGVWAPVNVVCELSFVTKVCDGLGPDV